MIGADRPSPPADGPSCAMPGTLPPDRPRHLPAPLTPLVRREREAASG